MPASHEPLPNEWRLSPLSLGKASDMVSNLEHIKRPLLGSGDTLARSFSMCQPLNTVLFYTWLAYTATMPRKLVWIEGQAFQGFGCSECNWVFRPSDTLARESLDEMKQKFEAQCDKEFAAHICVKHPRATGPKTE